MHFVSYMRRCQNFEFRLRRDNQKIPYERCVYESVDDSSLSWGTSQKRRKNSYNKGLSVLFDSRAN